MTIKEKVFEFMKKNSNKWLSPNDVLNGIGSGSIKTIRDVLLKYSKEGILDVKEEKLSGAVKKKYYCYKDEESLNDKCIIEEEKKGVENKKEEKNKKTLIVKVNNVKIMEIPFKDEPINYNEIIKKHFGEIKKENITITEKHDKLIVDLSINFGTKG